jgi:wobble nucleotide-excising tRNase
MIAKILKIKHLGLVFADYSWETTLPSFKRFNLIYGWNGCGKTTLSWLFDALNGTQKTSGLEYEIEDDQGNKYRQNDSFNKKVRVFNQDYIRANVKILEGRANSISIMLGEENKELLAQIQADELILNGNPSAQGDIGKIAMLANTKKEKDQKEAEKGNKYTEIAKTIGAAIGGNALRDYRKPQAEKDFNSLAVKEIMNDEELNKCALSAKQTPLPPIDVLAINKIKMHDEDDSVEVADALPLILSNAESLLQQTVETEVISRLSDNSDISEWVEQGVHLHQEHKSDVCEYCLQKIPSNRIEQLTRHFNDADKRLKTDADNLLAQVGKLYSAIDMIKMRDKANLYDELQTKYEAVKSQVEIFQKDLLTNIKNLGEEIKNKKAKTTVAVAMLTRPDAGDCLNGLAQANEVISEHNNKTFEFERVKEDACKKIKSHWLSTIYDEVKTLGSQIAECEGKIQKIEKGDPENPGDIGIEGLKKRIYENKAQISSTHKACDEINKGIATFLGRKELHFVPHTEQIRDENGEERAVDSGYLIMRGDTQAHDLSEGEKTAIAFVYFIVHLKDREFSASSGIIVIDDPISSLDSNSLFQAFAFLKNSVRAAEQVFILTHNFAFLKLLLNWAKNIPKKEGEKGYFMIKNSFTNNQRKAFITDMDKELKEYESEYHYLFKILKEFESDGSIAQAYPIPNIARKVLDTFLLFRVPSGEGHYKKLEALKPHYDEVKMAAIYKFTNDQSHITGSGFDPALVPETQKNVAHLLEMMKTVFPEHYRILEESIK